MMNQSLRKAAKSSPVPVQASPQKAIKQRTSRTNVPKTIKHKAVKKATVARKRGASLKRRSYSKRRRTTLMVEPLQQDRQTTNADTREIYEHGYQEGRIAGGELLLEEFLPPDLIIPDLTAREAIAVGVQALRKRGIPLLDSHAVYRELENALKDKKPYAFIRLGDGELLTMAQEKVLTSDEIKQAGSFLPYAGVTIPDLRARDEMASCIQVASLVGVPLSRHPHFQPLLFAVLRAHGIEYRNLRYTSSTMNYLLDEQGLMSKLLNGRKILVIGDVAEQLGQALRDKGMEVTGIVTPVSGYSDVARVVAEASGYDYDIALVAAGVAAIPICVHLAGIGGKVTFDFGHLANRMAGLDLPDRRE
ncbi:GT-D fold domain-containing glycosyltransferase [Cohnella lupini]|uniref:GT-D fold-like domain-containing protein n=1 Tax=Cohnella lupini TaxID=1294267 RepID=A0A3D9I5N3_9BACL|nr:GT-D fold domain-containing glycosyltransferase [Cohnella lupini]RED57092.1 hypothetical protein DFP95_1113 [Cohnella lupini]